MKQINQQGGQSGSALILYDGFCRLCSGIVKFIYKRDRRKIFTFRPIQKEGDDDLRKRAYEKGHIPETIVFVKSGIIYTRSDAVLQILKLMRFPWNFLWILRIIPRSIRDPLYSLIAGKRYLWFGRRDNCYIPDN